MDHYVHDYETLSNCFVAVFEHYKEDWRKVFVIHKLRNDLPELLGFLRQNKLKKEWHISFNGLAFDSQITEFIIRDKTFITKSADEVAKAIYAKAQYTINKVDRWPDIPEWQLNIGQIDVFKLNHWDNPARRSSLKWLQFAMDWPNVQEMPIHHTYEVKTLEEIDLIIEYCINDVRSTKALLHLSKPLLDVRSKINAKYGLKCYSFSNTKMGSELLLKLYCDMTGQEKREIKECRTYRKQIPINEILFPYIEFESLDLVGFHEMLKGKIIKNTKKDFKYVLPFMGYKFHYGAGGIHQCIERGIYKADGRFIIRDLDVISQYPSIACMNGMYPAHLGREFFKVYKEGIVDVRMAEKAKPEKERDMAIIEGFKEAANATFGNSLSEFSWLLDSYYGMGTTINGQLLITMLVEDLLLNIPEAQLLQTNTDGATLKFPKEYEGLYADICKAWEKVTKLNLEFADYQAMYIWDVNNYMANYTNGKTKCKGRFEWEAQQDHKVTHLYKNKSHLIVPKALFNYFINDVPPEKYLMENRNIYDYCAGIKIKGDHKFVQRCFFKQGFQDRNLQQTLRYYVATEGCQIFKIKTEDGSQTQIEAGTWLTQEFNVYQEKKWEDYNVDESYYLEQIYKEINNLVPKKSQLKLEFDA